MKIKIPRKNYTSVFEYIADHVNCREDRFLYYDYSQWGEWKNVMEKGKIICPIHGEFWQSMDKHIIGHGCPECGKIKQAKKLSFINFDEFLLYNRHKRKDGFGHYNYSKVVLKGTHEKVEIICPVEDHGSFYQSMDNHIKDQGCPKCAGKYSCKDVYEYIELNKDTCERFTRDNDDFSKAKFKNVDTPIEIICGKCSRTYWQSMTNYKSGHNGCSFCAKSSISKSSLVFFDNFYNKLVTGMPSLSNYIHYGYGNEVKVKPYSIDFAIIKDNIKIAIEFNGEYYHASPRLYEL